MSLYIHIIYIYYIYYTYIYICAIYDTRFGAEAKDAKSRTTFNPETPRSEHLFTVGLMSIAVLQGRPGVGTRAEELPVEDHLTGAC